MGRLMSKHLDKGKVERAFKLAARSVHSGSKDARSGKFVVQSDKRGRSSTNKAPRKEK
jgi:hypothetical protein